MNQEKIGRFIALNRKKKHLTQEALAAKLNISTNAVSKWERGLNLPDVSLMKKLCNILDISLNELFQGEYITNENIKSISENNIIEVLDYSDTKINKKNKTIAILLILIGLLFSFVSMTIFPSESSFGSIGAVIGVIISIIGFSILLNKIKIFNRIVLITLYFIILIFLLIFIDYISVVNIKQAPRFATYKIYSDKAIYYDTVFYDVIRCNKDSKNEYYKVIKNQKYDKNNIQKYCKKI